MDLAGIDRRTRAWREARAEAIFRRGLRPGARPVRNRDGSLHWRARDVNEWHAKRARSLSAGWQPKVEACGRPVDGVFVECRACGCHHQATHRCSQRNLCSDCARRYWARTRRRMVESFGPIARELARFPKTAPERCGVAGCGCASLADACAWELRLWTFTLRHSGDLGADLRTLQAGWVRFRAWLAKRGFRGLDYVKVVEVTPGTAGDGHVHAHVIVTAPPVCFAWMRREWQLCIEDPGACGVDVQRPRSLSAEQAAGYVAKYASKGSQLTGALLEAWLQASYGRRVLSASVGLLAQDEPAPCADCEERGGLHRVRVRPAGGRSGAARAPPGGRFEG